MVTKMGIRLMLAAVALVAVAGYSPAVSLAQEVRAGVVTTLQGQAIVHRAVLPQAISLNFKDEVFRQDRIDTRTNSLVRVLLAGKALVTVRELSSLTITEEPGRAVVDLKTGKVALGLVKSLMRPGEAAEIHTPNAIVAVRGSLVVVEVATIAGAIHTLVTAIHASVPITVSPRMNPAAIVPLRPNEAVRVSGAGAATTVGPVERIAPERAKEIGRAAEVSKPAEHRAKPPEGVVTKIREAQIQKAAEISVSALLPEQVGAGTAKLSGVSPLVSPLSVNGADLTKTITSSSTFTFTSTSTSTFTSTSTLTSPISSTLSSTPILPYTTSPLLGK